MQGIDLKNSQSGRMEVGTGEKDFLPQSSFKIGPHIYMLTATSMREGSVSKDSKLVPRRFEIEG